MARRVALGAARRNEESRGAHTRLDFEGEREEWVQYDIILSRKADGGMDCRKEKRDDPPEELARIAHATIEDVEAGNV